MRCAGRFGGRIAEAILSAVREHAGASWNTVDGQVSGKADRKREVRDLLLESGKLVNTGGEKKFVLYTDGDPVLAQLRPDGDAPGTTLTV